MIVLKLKTMLSVELRGASAGCLLLVFFIFPFGKVYSPSLFGRIYWAHISRAEPV